MDIKEANAELKAARAGVSIRQLGDRLYLQATFPPKPGNGKEVPHQQTLTLGIYANPQGVKRAKAEALRIGGLLACKEFRWEDFQRQKINPPAPTETIAQWLEKFEQHYFARRARTPKTETSFQDYTDAWKFFPDLNAPLSAETILAAVVNSPPDSRQRSRACIALGALAKFAGLEVNLTPYKGSYSPYEAIQERNIPSDRLIEQSRSAISNPSWQWAYGIIATYGIRPHELFYLKLENFHQPPGILVLGPGGKSGPRKIWPLHPHWWEKWELVEVNQPQCTGKNNSALGERVDHAFSRYGVPFVPYDLRHAYAIRTAIMGLSIAIASKFLGHSPMTHHRQYHRWIDDSHLQAAWKEATGGGRGGQAAAFPVE